MNTPAPLPSAERVRRLRALAHLLDSSIRVPGTRWRVGLDPILGLVPGFGDLAGAGLSGYLVFEAARLGARGPTLARMLANVAIEAVLGFIPLLGDLFDAAWKANERNLRLLERHLGDPRGARRASRTWLFAAALAIAGSVLLAAALGFWLLVAVVRALAASGASATLS